METINLDTKLPPEIWMKIFDYLNTLQPDYSKGLYTSDILNCYHVCVTFHNILKSAIISSFFPRILPFIHPYVTNKSIKPIVNCRLVCKAWKQGVDHFIQSHDIFTRKQFQEGKVHTNDIITSSLNNSIPITSLFTKQDITQFIYEMDNINGSPFIGNSLLLRFSPLDDVNGPSDISISSVQELVIRFGHFIKVLHLFVFQYQYLDRFWEIYPYRKFYDQIRNILEYTPNLRRLCVKGYLKTNYRLWFERFDVVVDEEVEMLNLSGLDSVEIDIGGRHAYGLKLAINLGISSLSFSQLKRLSFTNTLYDDNIYFVHRKISMQIWSRVCGCLPNLEQLDVRIVDPWNLMWLFHLASKSTKLKCLTISIARHSWKDHFKLFSKYYQYSVDPYYESLYASAQQDECECYSYRRYRLELENLLRTVECLFGKSLETLAIFVEDAARKYCKVNPKDLDILGEMPHLRNLHVEGFPLFEFEIVRKLPTTLKSLVLSGFSRAFYFYRTNKFKMMPGVSTDLKDGLSIYQSELWEQLPGLRWISVVLWDHKTELNAVYLYRREKRDWLIRRNEQVKQEEPLLEKRTFNETCCFIV